MTLRTRTTVAGHPSFLLDQIRAAQVSERRRIARDQHDRTGHSISVTHRQLELGRLYRDSDPERAEQTLAVAQEAVIESVRNLRAVTSDPCTAPSLTGLRSALLTYLVVSMDITRREIRSLVRDDGRGFGPHGDHGPECPGRSSMRERARQLGGMLTIRSRPGHGTRVGYAGPLS